MVVFKDYNTGKVVTKKMLVAVPWGVKFKPDGAVEALIAPEGWALLYYGRFPTVPVWWLHECAFKLVKVR